MEDVLLKATLGDLSSVPNAKGQPGTLMGGVDGSLYVSETHGKFAQQVLSGNVFIGSTALAGTTIPVNANNLASTFTLLNPLGSNRYLELIRYDLGIAGTTTAVIGSLSLVGQTGHGGPGFTMVSSVTALTPVNALLGGTGRSPVGKLMSAATFSGTPSVFMSLGLSFGTTGANPGPVKAWYEFDGTLILAPGAIVTVVSTAAQTQPMQQQFIWAEIPISG